MSSDAHDITKMQNKRLLFELMSLTAHITRATETGGSALREHGSRGQRDQETKRQPGQPKTIRVSHADYLVAGKLRRARARRDHVPSWTDGTVIREPPPVRNRTG